MRTYPDIGLILQGRAFKSTLFFNLFSVFCAVLLLFCLIGTILDVITEALVNSEQNTSPSDQHENVELQPIEINTEPDNKATASSSSSPSGPLKFLKCKFRFVKCPFQQSFSVDLR